MNAIWKLDEGWGRPAFRMQLPSEVLTLSLSLADIDNEEN